MTSKPGHTTYYAITEIRMSSASQNYKKKNKQAGFYLTLIYKDN